MTGSGVRLGVFGRTDVGKLRKGNEDAFVIADLSVPTPLYATPQPLALEVGPSGVLLAVSDGMGGAQAGEVASALALHSLRQSMSAGAGGTAEAALQASVEHANQKVWQASALPGHKGMGATLTAVLLHGNRAYVAEVGDSRAYLLRGDRFVQLTRDQSALQAMLDAGTLTRESADDFPYKNVILQAIGTTSKVVVALNRFSLRRGDCILLCSDGLSGPVKDEEIQRIVIGAPTLDAACNTLIDLANSRGGDDNITVVLAQMDGEGLPAPDGDGRLSLVTIQAYTS